MSKSFVATLVTLAIMASLLVMILPAFAQGEAPGSAPIKPDGAGFATPPRDSDGPPASAGGGTSYTKYIIAVAIVAVVAAAIAFALQKGKKSA